MGSSWGGGDPSRSEIRLGGRGGIHLEGRDRILRGVPSSGPSNLPLGDTLTLTIAPPNRSLSALGFHDAAGANSLCSDVNTAGDPARTNAIIPAASAARQECRWGKLGR